MSLQSEMAADLAAAVADYDYTFEWAGRAGIPGVRSAPGGAFTIQSAGGEIDAAAFRIVVCKAAFPDGRFPDEGDIVNASSFPVQIKDVDGDKNPDAVQLVLHLGSVDL